MKTPRFAVIGAGFWSQYQLSAWNEIGGARCVAICDVDREKAVKLGAQQVDSPAVYDDPAELMKREELDFVDIITSPETHRQVVELAAQNRLDAICQKPLAGSFAEAEHMVATCDEAGVTLLVHENFRWQTPIRQVKHILDEGRIGSPFRARIHFCSSFPVFDKQPFLATLDRFILLDVGTHLLDVARFLFGAAESVYCSTERVNPDIRGEDVATVILKMDSGAIVVNELSYASRLREEQFPQTYVFVEGRNGSIELVRDYWIHVTTEQGTESRRYPPATYHWADPAYNLTHSSLVACNENLLLGVTKEGTCETTASDNLETLRLVFASYESAHSNRVMMIPKRDR